jgi:HK97 gp10 family phage protein
MSVKYKIPQKAGFYNRLQSTVPGIEDAIKEATIVSAKEMVEKARSLAPEVDGDLKRSINYTVGQYRPSNGNVRGTTARNGGKDAVTVHAGDEKAFYADWVEFGTANSGKRPYFYPAYRLLRRKIKGRISRAMTKSIKRKGF